jgi:mannan endo-1,4-beta-mannosidase
MNRLLRGALASVALLVAVLVVLQTAGTARAASSTGFVSRRGTSLTVHGQTWRFAGFNLPCQQPFLLSPSALGYYFDNIKFNAKANVVRMWWFQSNFATSGNPWAPFDQVASTAAAHGIRIVPALTNEWDACDEPNPQGPEKDTSWYQGGYRQPEGGYRLSFRSFAVQMARHFANDPTIAFWQLVNEAQAPTIDSSGFATCDPTAAVHALRSFGDDVASAIHRNDSHHLVNLGTQGTGQCGADNSAAYRYVHAGAIDLCEFHDYGNPAVAMSTGPNSLDERIHDCHALGKPIFVGESGIPANVQPDGSSGSAPVDYSTLSQRAAFFKAKIDAGRSAGLVGYEIWFKSPFYTPSMEPFAIGDGDPTEPILADAL